MDLLDFWRGALTWRRLEVLIKHLPADSAFRTAAEPDGWRTGRWTPETHMVAELWDLLHAAHSTKQQRYPRPSELVEQAQASSERQSAHEAMEARNRARRGEA